MEPRNSIVEETRQRVYVYEQLKAPGNREEVNIFAQTLARLVREIKEVQYRHGFFEEQYKERIEEVVKHWISQTKDRSMRTEQRRILSEQLKNYSVTDDDGYWNYYDEEQIDPRTLSERIVEELVYRKLRNYHEMFTLLMDIMDAGEETFLKGSTKAYKELTTKAIMIIERLERAKIYGLLSESEVIILDDYPKIVNRWLKLLTEKEEREPINYAVEKDENYKRMIELGFIVEGLQLEEEMLMNDENWSENDKVKTKKLVREVRRSGIKLKLQMMENERLYLEKKAHQVLAEKGPIVYAELMQKLQQDLIYLTKKYGDEIAELGGFTKLSRISKD